MIVPIDLFFKIAKIVGINAHLLIAICTVETKMVNINNFNDNGSASYGVAQVKLSTAREIVPYIDALALQQPQVNLRIASLYLKKHLKIYNNIADVIAAYNYGSVKKLKNNNYINQKYVDNVEYLLYNKIEEMENI